MLKLNYNSKVATSRNVGKKDLVNGYVLNKPVAQSLCDRIFKLVLGGLPSLPVFSKPGLGA
ncbi:MAG: hypothetical protein LBV23_10825 [Deltaproteobacteria bacterium]|jgi:hypothetical protein|nr:hypothetical protein [Deltaproteobacteria bacterium]